MKEPKKYKEYEVRVTVNNQVTLDPIEPVPVSFSGNIFRYSGNRKYIPFLDENDDFGNKLIQCRLLSSTQNSCIGSIASSLVGKGLTVKGQEVIDSKVTDWWKRVNNKKQTMSEFLVSTGEGERAFGNQFIEVVKGSVGSKKFVKINLPSFLESRLVTPEDEDEEPTHVIIDKRLIRDSYVYLSGELKTVPIYDELALNQKDVWWIDSKGNERTIIHYKNEISGVPYYGLPASVGSLRYQILEAKAAQYNIDNFDNNMILGGMLIFKAGMTQSEAETQAKNILLSHIGEGKTGRIAVVSSEGGMQEVEFIPFTTDKEGSYIEYDKRVEEKIIAANNWDSILCGINRDTSLGNGSNYIRSIWDVKDATLLHPLREKLISKVVKPIMNIWADWMGVPVVKDYEYLLQTNMPFSFMADLDPNSFFMVNEARQKAGLPHDKKKEGVYVSEMKGKADVQKATTQTQNLNQ